MTPIYQQDRRPTVKRVRWMLLIGALLLLAAFVALPLVANAQTITLLPGQSRTITAAKVKPETVTVTKTVTKCYNAQLVQITCPTSPAPIPPTPTPIPPTPTPQPPADTSSTIDMAGFTAIASRPYAALNTEGWYDDNAPDRYAIATTPSGPAAQFKYPAGFTAGASPAVSEKGLGTKYRTVHLSYYSRLSANWFGERSATNKQIFLWIGNEPAIFTSGSCVGNGPIRPFVQLQGSVNTQLEPNVNTTKMVERGVRHRWDLRVRENTANQSDGELWLWLDGILVSHYPNFRLQNAGGLWELVKIDPTWGGNENDKVPADQYLWIDHVEVWGKP
jgi:hypothetical protein